MRFSPEFLAQWEHIISGIQVTALPPLECIKKLIIKLPNKKQKTINLSMLRRQGLNSEELETVLNRALQELNDQITDVEFIVDTAAVAQIVQPETDKLLEKFR